MTARNVPRCCQVSGGKAGANLHPVRTIVWGDKELMRIGGQEVTRLEHNWRWIRWFYSSTDCGFKAAD